jgi:hypothetical protein
MDRAMCCFSRPVSAIAIAIGSAACVPADEAIQLGGVQFTFKVSQRTTDGIIADETSGNAIRFDRTVLSFKTMTIGKVGTSGVCSYRGRPVNNVVFDPRAGLVQSFNGIEPVDCPDVGIIFGAPTDATTLGKGVSSAELLDLATGRVAHALVEATATRELTTFDGRRLSQQLRIIIRLDSERTATRFSGCREARRGVLIVADQRDEVTVRFAPENFFRKAVSTTGPLSVWPFLQADQQGNDDGTVTMEEMDALPLSDVFSTPPYVLPDGTQRGSFGDYVRALFRVSVMFRTEEGLCYGKEPGAPEDE